MDKIDRAGGIFQNVSSETAKGEGASQTQRKGAEKSAAPVHSDAIREASEMTQGLSTFLGLKVNSAEAPPAGTASKVKDPALSKLEEAVQERLLSAGRGKPETSAKSEGSAQTTASDEAAVIRSAIRAPGPAGIRTPVDAAGPQSEVGGKRRLTDEQQKFANPSLDDISSRIGSRQGSDSDQQRGRIGSGKSSNGAGSTAGPGRDPGRAQGMEQIAQLIGQQAPGMTPETSAGKAIDALVGGELPGMSPDERRAKLLADAGFSDPGNRLGGDVLSSAGKSDRTGPTYGQGMLADNYNASTIKTRNKDGSTTTTDERITTTDDKVTHYVQNVTEDKDGHVSGWTSTKTDIYKDGVRIVTETKSDGENGNSITEKKTTSFPTGQSITTTTTTTINSDGSKTTHEKTTVNPTKDPGGWEDNSGGIPEDFKKLQQHFLDQLRAAGPHKGGEEVNPGDGDSMSGGTPVDDPQIRLAEMGKFGLIGQPDLTAEHGSGAVLGSVQPGGGNGGDIDFGPDSGETGWTGATREEDPGDVQLGPTAPLDPKSDSKTEEKDTTEEKFSRFNRKRG